MDGVTYFERHIARLLLILYSCGRPVNSLLDGETRQVDSIWELQRFDFWTREPGHLALALIDTATADDQDRRAVLDRMMSQIDIRRVGLPGSPYHYLEDFDESLAFLTSRALVSDRPSFIRSKSYAHQIILENAGINIVKRILAECPSFGWYQQQCETVQTYFTQLEMIDLTTMPYLQPDLTPLQAATVPLEPYIRARYEARFGGTTTSVGETADALV